MPGFQFVGQRSGFQGVPSVDKYLLANSMTGTGTPPAAAVYNGDVVVLTTKSTLTSNSNTVLRMLLAADKTAHYKEGAVVAGILGISLSDIATNASGQAVAPPVIAPGVVSGAAISYPLSEPAMWGQDRATNRNFGKVALFSAGNEFLGRLDMAGGAITLQHQYDGTLAGIIMNTTAGVTTFTIDTGAAAADQCIRIIRPNDADPLYNTLVASGAAVGPSVIFEAVPSFQQNTTNVPYSTQ